MREISSKAKSARVLIVDDAPSMRSLLAAILKSFGVKRIFEAENTQSAMKYLETVDIDVVFCDWEMPGKTGLEFFQELRKQQSYADLPFILVTSVAEIEKVKTAIQAGVKHYVVKPFKEATLMDKIDDIFPCQD